MKKHIFILACVIGLVACTKEKQQFEGDVLETDLVDYNGNETQLKYVLSEVKKTTVIDIWASWCQDCLNQKDDLKALKTKYNQKLDFINLSVDNPDRTEFWKKAILKFQMSGKNFRVTKGWDKSATFSKFLGLRSIPRYLLVTKDNKIIHFKATDINDKEFIEKIEKSIQ